MRIQTKRVFWIDNECAAIDLDIALQSGCIIERSFESQNGVFVILVDHYPNGTPWIFPQNVTDHAGGERDPDSNSHVAAASRASDGSPEDLR